MTEFCSDLEAADFPESLIKVVTSSDGTLKRTLNITHKLANSPATTEMVFGCVQSLLHGLKLDPGYREIAICRVAQIHGSAYEHMYHLAVARFVGVEEVKLKALPVWREHPSFTENDRIILQFTEELTANAVSSLTKERVASLLPLEERIELAWVISFYGALARMLTVLDVRLEEPEPDPRSNLKSKDVLGAPASEG